MLEPGLTRNADHYAGRFNAPHSCRRKFPLELGDDGANKAFATWKRGVERAVKKTRVDGLWRIGRDHVKGLQYYGRVHSPDRQTRFWARDDNEAIDRFTDWRKGLLFQTKHGTDGGTFADVFEMAIKSIPDEDTRAQYRKLNKRGLKYFGRTQVQDITQPMVYQFLSTECVKANGQPLAEATVRQVLIPINLTLNGAIERGMLTGPSVATDLSLKTHDFVAKDEGRKDTLDADECALVFDHVSLKGRRHEMMVRCQAGLGLRWGEATAMRLGDFHEVKGAMYYRVRWHFIKGLKLKPRSKTGKKDAHRFEVGVPVPAALYLQVQEYAEWLEQVSDPFIGPGDDDDDRPAYREGGWLFSGHGRSSDEWHAGIDYGVMNTCLKGAFGALAISQGNVTHALRKAYSDATRELYGRAVAAENMGHSEKENAATYSTETAAEGRAKAAAAEALLVRRPKLRVV